MNRRFRVLTAMWLLSVCMNEFASAEPKRPGAERKVSAEMTYKSLSDECSMDDEGACKKLRMACSKENPSPCFHLASALGFQGQGQDEIDYLTQACDWGHAKSCAALPRARREASRRSTDDSALSAEGDRLPIEQQRLELEAQRIELQRRQVEVMERAEESERLERNLNMVDQYFDSWRQPASTPAVQQPKKDQRCVNDCARRYTLEYCTKACSY